MFLKKRNKTHNFGWLAVLAYPFAFIKGIVIGRMLSTGSRGR